MIRDKEIQDLQNEIADLRRKQSEASQALASANETIKTSTEISLLFPALSSIIL